MTLDFRADLHCHTTFSDGTDTPEELIQQAIDKGLSGLSITDHDTIAAYAPALAYAQKKNFPLLCGAEFSASYREEPIHILAYAPCLQNGAIQKLCIRHKKRREERNLKMLDKLRVLGIGIDYEDLKGLIQGTWGRPHIAHVLLQKGVVKSIQEAFDLYLAEGKRAYAPGELISVEETLAIIHQAKGKAVLAHPHLIKRSTTVRMLLRMPFDGLECYYARFNASQEKKWIDLAQQRKWLITGGSDYHGTTKPYNILGASWVCKETFDLLYNHFLSVN